MFKKTLFLIPTVLLFIAGSAKADKLNENFAMAKAMIPAPMNLSENYQKAPKFRKTLEDLNTLNWDTSEIAAEVRRFSDHGQYTKIKQAAQKVSGAVIAYMAYGTQEKQSEVLIAQDEFETECKKPYSAENEAQMKAQAALLQMSILSCLAVNAINQSPQEQHEAILKRIAQELVDTKRSEARYFEPKDTHVGFWVELNPKDKNTTLEFELDILRGKTKSGLLLTWQDYNKAIKAHQEEVDRFNRPSPLYNYNMVGGYTQEMTPAQAGAPSHRPLLIETLLKLVKGIEL